MINPESGEPLPMAALGQCTGCGGLLFANVFHICAANAHLYKEAISKDELDKLMANSFVPAPPMPSDSGVFAEPPEVVIKTDRTHCEHCKTELHPDVYHKCAGNEEYKPEPVVEAPSLPILSAYKGVCPSAECGPSCPLCNGTGVIE